MRGCPGVYYPGPGVAGAAAQRASNVFSWHYRFCSTGPHSPWCCARPVPAAQYDPWSVHWEETSPDSMHRGPGQFYRATTARYAKLSLWLFRGRYGVDLCECQPNLPRFFLCPEISQSLPVSCTPIKRVRSVPSAVNGVPARQSFLSPGNDTRRRALLALRSRTGMLPRGLWAAPAAPSVAQVRQAPLGQHQVTLPYMASSPPSYICRQIPTWHASTLWHPTPRRARRTQYRQHGRAIL